MRDERSLRAEDARLETLIDELVAAAKHMLFESPAESALDPVGNARAALEEYIAEIRVAPAVAADPEIRWQPNGRE